VLDQGRRSWLICAGITKTTSVFLLLQIEIVEFRMSGDVCENDLDFESGDLSEIAETRGSPQRPRDARRMVEDKLEEMRLRRELMDYSFEV
jgi:hypothetical protein